MQMVKEKIELGQNRGSMKKLNIIVVYDKEEKNILFCYRKKEPYKGLYNLVGGKVEENETDIEAAYRELEEETSISKKDISLKHVMTFYYPMSDIELQAYVGKLKRKVILREEVNQLCWFSTKENFWDMKRFAGEGNIGHLLEQIKFYHDQLLK